MKFKLGDRVKYMSGEYGSSPSNPLFNGKWNCCGTVVFIISTRRCPVRVDWDNKESNVYEHHDLAHWIDQHALPEELFEI